MALYGKAVGDSTYYDYVEPEFKYNDKTAYYYSAASDSSILYQGNANDAAFISEFDSLSNTNVGLLYDAEQALNNNDYTTMQTRLSSMVNKNTIEQNKSEALNYYVDYVAKDSIADSASVFNLKNKGYQHPFLGGDAVYWIRAMFDIEHEDQMPR
ncbi:MAG: hypothetical protein IPP29_16170 [Bacteroidetes bacterium]|nr:hypothetical protein [Bacteroidota bacterium]